jgi:hypothetical protein
MRNKAIFTALLLLAPLPAFAQSSQFWGHHTYFIQAMAGHARGVSLGQPRSRRCAHWASPRATLPLARLAR